MGVVQMCMLILGLLQYFYQYRGDAMLPEQRPSVSGNERYLYFWIMSFPGSCRKRGGKRVNDDGNDTVSVGDQNDGYPDRRVAARETPAKTELEVICIIYCNCIKGRGIPTASSEKSHRVLRQQRIIRRVISGEKFFICTASVHKLPRLFLG